MVNFLVVNSLGALHALPMWQLNSSNTKSFMQVALMLGGINAIFCVYCIKIFEAALL
jgi:hypothetical protein